MPPTPQISRRLIFVQALLGIGASLAIALPFLRRTNGLQHLRTDQRYLFVCNHVSLLDTILLGAIFWLSDNYPMLTLGDKNVWHASRIRRWLSQPTSFLLDRGKLNPGKVRELQAFGRAAKDFNLLVFPEGTRGNGVQVAECQPGIYFIAQEACVPIVPIFIENMQLVSTKHGKFDLFGGFRKVEVHFGEPIAPKKYLALSRDEFMEFVRQKISTAKALQPTAHLNPALHRV